MSLLNKKSWWHRILNSRLTILVLLVASVSLSFAVYNRYVVEHSVRERRSETEQDLNELRARQAELEDKVEYLNDEQGLEAEIRRHFDVSKKGEQVVVLMGKTATLTPATVTENKVEDEDSFWSSLIPW